MKLLLMKIVRIHKSLKIVLFFLIFIQTTNAQNVLFDEVDLYVNSTNYEDRVRVRINEVATNGNDLGVDALKFLSSNTAVPQIYSRMTVTEGTYSFSVNSLPRNVSGVTKVPLSLRYGEKGTYTIRASDILKKAPNCTKIEFIDSISTTNKTIKDLRVDSVHTFTYTGNPATTHTRFKLRIYTAIPYVAVSNNSDKISCTYPTVTLTANATSGSTYLWSTGETTRSIDVNEPNNYSVTISYSGKTFSDTKTIFLDTVSPTLVITSPTNELSCTTSSVKLTGVASNVSYLWSTGSTKSNITITEEGSYTLTVTDADNGCAASAEKVITENKTPPAVEIIASSDVLTCAKKNIELTAETDFLPVLWSTSETSSQISVQEPGDYSVSIINPANGCVGIATKLIAQNITPPSVSIEASAQQLTCSVQSVQLTAVASNVSYLWNTDESSFHITVNEPDNYSVTAVDLTNGCNSVATVEITQNIIPPSVQISSPSNELTCAYPTIDLIAIAQNVSYQWSTDETDSRIAVNKPGDYTLIVTDLTTGCKNTVEKNITFSGDIQSPYYKSRTDGNWSGVGMWNVSADADLWRCTVKSPTEDAVSVVLSNAIMIESGDEINVKNLKLEPLGLLLNEGSLVISDTLTFVIDENGTSKFKNDGTVINNGVIKVRKTFKATDGWVFMSFPFNVSANNIFIGGTNTNASWGSLGESNKDIYIFEYDGESRDINGTFSTINSPNWKNVNPKFLIAKKGYIMAVDTDKTIDFVSGNGEVALFESTAQVNINKYTTNALPIHNSWNLIGIPFSSSFNLINATQSHAPFYYYDGNSYQTVMEDDSYEANPFASFFLQAHGVPNVVSFASNGRMLKSMSTIKDYTEIGLTLSNDKYSDKTRIRLQNEALELYELGKDAIKIYSQKNNVPQIYSITNGYNLSVNALPLNTIKVDLGMKLNDLGTYTIQLSDKANLENYKRIILKDNEEGAEVDLLTDESYTFSSSVGAKNRFALYFMADSSTDVNMPEGEIIINNIGNKITIDGLTSLADMRIYDVSGRLVKYFTDVHNGNIFTLNELGVYMINIKTSSQTVKAKIFISK